MGSTPFIRNFMLCLWLFAVTAPSIITFIDVDEPVIIVNINEEEQQEQGKKTQSEEKIPQNGIANLLLLSNLKKTSVTDFYLYGQTEHIIEIPIPPPENYTV